MSVYVPTGAGPSALLELFAVDWTRFEFRLSHGKKGPSDLPTDAPAMLRAFFDEDEELREEAEHAFYAAVCHQGSLSEVAAHVIPFLAAMSAPRDAPARGRMITCLLVAAAASLRPGTPHGAAVIESMTASRSWFKRGVREKGPRAMTEALSLLMRLDLLEDEEADDLMEAADEIQRLRPPPPRPPLSSKAAEARVRALLASEERRSERAVLLAERCVESSLGELALRVLSVADESRHRADRLALEARALFVLGRINEARQRAHRLARGWLAPPTGPHAPNQTLVRANVTRLLAIFDDAASASLRDEVLSAPEPDVWVPEGDYL